MRLPWFIIKRLIKRSVSKYGIWIGTISGDYFVVKFIDCDPEDPYGCPEFALYVNGVKQDLDPEYLVKFGHIDEVLDRIHEIVR